MLRFLQLILPIAIYFVAEQIWGCQWGVVFGFALCILLAVFRTIKEGRPDLKASAADAVLILLFCIGDMVSNGLPDSAGSSINSFLLSILLLASSTEKLSPEVGRMLDGLRPNISENPFAMRLIRNSLRRMSLWALVASVVYVISWLNDNEHAEAWVESYLLITVLLAYLATEIIISRIIKRKYRDSEWVPLKTENGQTIGGAPRELVHDGSHWLHAVVHLHVMNSRGELLLQLRPKSKKIQPGKWDTAVGGHITFGEKLQDALRRETAEEIGLTNFEARYTGHYIWKCEAENEYVFVFTTNSDGPFRPQNIGEVEDLKFWSASELSSALGTGILTPNIEKELQDGLLKSLPNT